MLCRKHSVPTKRTHGGEEITAWLRKAPPAVGAHLTQLCCDFFYNLQDSFAKKVQLWSFNLQSTTLHLGKRYFQHNGKLIGN